MGASQGPRRIEAFDGADRYRDPNAKPTEKLYKIADSQGLYLLVNPRRSKLWRVKYRMNGVEWKLALGFCPEISLAEARAARDSVCRQLAHAVDPNVTKRQARMEASIRASNSFATVAEKLIEKKAREGLRPHGMPDDRKAHLARAAVSIVLHRQAKRMEDRTCSEQHIWRRRAQ